MIKNPVVFPQDTSSLQVLQTLAGSSKPKQVRDQTTGNLFVMKQGFNTKHVANEYRANLCYLSMGCLVPQMKIYRSGKVVDSIHDLDHISDSDDIAVLSQFIDGGVTWSKFQQDHSVEECNAVRREVARYFVLDCLFANRYVIIMDECLFLVRDVIGSDDSNILIVTQPHNFLCYRIDNGGSLNYRAQGKLKDPGDWTGFVSEINLMLDSSFNSNTGNMFGKGAGIQQDQLLEQTMDIISKAEQCIYPHLSAEDVKVVRERLEYLQGVTFGFYNDLGGGVTSTNTGITGACKADPSLVRTMMDMGLPKEQCENALEMCNNSMERALELIFGGMQ